MDVHLKKIVDHQWTGIKKGINTVIKLAPTHIG